ncbi:response regulator [Desulfovibrio mangrovi]|uniref:response regulator n=1 Tax=Desulfovibrio mangrovi TaxID=2976983 RepID=UPI0022480711|nr:response regulator [Desulfovibrio mangrovi]UZP69024.1 response regulator [Desulfovibrio mangrovi]
MTIPDSPLRSLRILIADESMLNRRIYTAMLERRGHTVVSVAKGREVLAELLRDVFDVLVMDAVLPEMDGVEATEAIRSSVTDRVDASIPVIVLSGSQSEGDRERFMKAGVDGVLIKPVRITALLKTVRDVMLHKGRQVEPGGAEEVAQVKDGQLRQLDYILSEFGLEKDDVYSLYALMQESLPREFAALKVASEEGWLEEVAEVAHSLAGSALDIVADGPALVAREIEYAARSGDVQEARQLCVEMEPQVVKVYAEIGRLLAESA